MSYINRICPYCGVSPIKATPDMTQEVGQRDGHLFTYGCEGKRFIDHEGTSIDGENIEELYFVFASARHDPVVITIGGDDWETAVRVPANDGHHHIFTDGGFIFVPGEYPLPAQEIRKAEIEGADISKVHIYYR